MKDADQCRLISGECADDCHDLQIWPHIPLYALHLLFKIIIMFALLVLLLLSAVTTLVQGVHHLCSTV